MAQTTFDNSAGRADQDWNAVEQQLKDKAGSLYDPTDLEGIKRNYYNSGPNGDQGGNLDALINQANQRYDVRAASQQTGSGPDSQGGSRDQALAQVSQTYSNSGGSSGGTDALSGFVDLLKQRDAEQQQRQGQLRDILMGQLTGLSKPVDANDPALAGVINANRLASQREAERQRRTAAEQLGARGLSDSGALDTALLGIDEKRAEQNQQFQGNVLYQELNNRRQALQSMLSQAMSIGDAESARNIAAQLSAIQSQIQNSQFNANLGFNYDQLGANTALAQAGLNQSALLSLLNAAG